MKFKHLEPLEVPPWKKRQRKGREAKTRGKMCGFDAGVSPWGMAGWLVLAGTWIRSAIGTFATFPKTPFRAIPRQQSRTNWEEGGSGAEDKQKRRNHKVKGKWMEPEKNGTERIKRDLKKKRDHRGRGGEQREWRRSACYHFSVYTCQSDRHSCTHTYNSTSVETGLGVSIWDRKREY